MVLAGPRRGPAVMPYAPYNLVLTPSRPPPLQGPKPIPPRPPQTLKLHMLNFPPLFTLREVPYLPHVRNVHKASTRRVYDVGTSRPYPRRIRGESAFCTFRT